MSIKIINLKRTTLLAAKCITAILLLLPAALVYAFASAISEFFEMIAATVDEIGKDFDNFWDGKL